MILLLRPLHAICPRSVGRLLRRREPPDPRPQLEGPKKRT